MQSEAFFDYVRGITDEVPSGHTKAGCDLYRHLVYIGVEQMLSDTHTNVKTGMGEGPWGQLIRLFITTTRWSSNYYGDLEDEFNRFLGL